MGEAAVTGAGAARADRALAISCLLATLSGAACLERRSEPPIPRPPLGTTHTAPPRTLPPDPEPAARYEPPPILQSLVAAIDAVGDEGRLDHGGVIAALEALSEALVIVEPDPTRHIRMRAAIDKLRSSPPTSTSHADHVRNALAQAVEIARDGAPRGSTFGTAYAATLADFGTAVAAIDPDELLLDQHARIVTALRAAAAVLHAALGLPPPRFDQPRVAESV